MSGKYNQSVIDKIVCVSLNDGAEEWSSDFCSQETVDDTVNQQTFVICQCNKPIPTTLVMYSSNLIDINADGNQNK